MGEIWWPIRETWRFSKLHGLYLGDSQIIQESWLRSIRFKSLVALFNMYLSSSISQFLNDNFDYDEETALEQLSAYGLKSFMFDVAKVNIICQAIT